MLDSSASIEFMGEYMTSYSQTHLSEVASILEKLSPDVIEKMVDHLLNLKNSAGRLFILGVGGSAGNASHAVNDFRKLAGIEAYAPTDNISELTARTNDEGWATVFSGWLRGSKMNAVDTILVLSVGGGSKELGISANLCEAIDFAKVQGTSILGIVGRDGGYTAKNADICLIIPTVNDKTVTPHSESFQTIVWHLLVSHPKLQSFATKW
jgi:D-sedoheptulose 7-phosphate isomerase